MYILQNMPVASPRRFKGQFRVKRKIVQIKQNLWKLIGNYQPLQFRVKRWAWTSICGFSLRIIP